MTVILKSLVKDFCHTLGVCYAGSLFFSAALYLSLLTEKMRPNDILSICIEFLFTAIATSIVVVSIVFLNLLRIEYQRYKRQQNHQSRRKD